MSQDLSPRAEAQGIPDTVAKQVSEHHGELPLLVYEHWSPVLKRQRRWLHSPIPNCSDLSAVNIWLSWFRTYLNPCAFQEWCVLVQQQQPTKWRCCRTSKSDGISFSIFSSSLFTLALQGHSWLPKQEVPWLFVNIFYSLHALRAARLRVYGLLCWLAVI